RNITEGETINSPNRFREFDDAYGLLRFVQKIREVGENPVGTKIVIGDETQIEPYVKVMQELDIVPDFITIDGSEGGSGATYYELAESVGLTTYAALPLLDDMLKKYGLRERTKIIASGKLLTLDISDMALELVSALYIFARGQLYTLYV